MAITSLQLVYKLNDYFTVKDWMMGGGLMLVEELECRLSLEFLIKLNAEYQVSKGFYGLAVFSLEQALQLFIKSKLLENGAEYPRTHSVRFLFRKAFDACRRG